MNIIVHFNIAKEKLIFCDSIVFLIKMKVKGSLFFLHICVIISFECWVLQVKIESCNLQTENSQVPDT